MSSSSGPGQLVFPVAPERSDRRVLWFLAWRAVGAVVIFLLVLTLVFYVAEVLPGDPTRLLLPRAGGSSCTGGQIGTVDCSIRQKIIEQWALDKPVTDRYVAFLINVLSGNLGTSITYRYGVPVWTIISGALPMTLAIDGGLLLLLAVTALPAGLRMSRGKGGRRDALESFLLALPFACPAAILGLLAAYLLMFRFPVFPIVPPSSPNPLAQFASQLWYLTLPGLILLGTSLALFTWVVRDHPLRPGDDLRPPIAGDWHPTKKPFGRRVIDSIPRYLATLPPLLAWFVGAELMIEIVFNVNGLGLLLWTAVVRQDFPLVMGTVLVLTLLVFLPALFLADIVHFAMTRRWARADGQRVEAFRVDPVDLKRGVRRVLRSALGVVGFGIILALLIVSAAAPLIVGPYQTYLALNRPFLTPSAAHPLGTDESGRDILNLLVYGGIPTVGIAILALMLALLAEICAIGAIGIFGDKVTSLLLIPLDLLLVLSLPFGFLLAAVIGSTASLWIPALVAAPVAGRLAILDTARIAEAGWGQPSPLTLRARGGRALNFIWGAGPIILGEAFLAVSLAIIAWTALGFVGLGLTGPGAIESWGQMLYNAYNNYAILRGAWWYFVPPMLLTFLAVLGTTLVSLEFKRVSPRGRRGGSVQEIPSDAVATSPPA